MKFQNRKKELNELEEILDRDKFQLVIIYGRRRVGKTELILQATKNKKRLYYLAVGENNLERFYKASLSNLPEISKLKEDYEILFDHLKNKVEVIILDEFQEMIKEDANILNLLQSIADNILKSSSLKLFLVGSSVSIITSKVLDYASPLYGRRSASLKLKPLDFFDFAQFFPGQNLKEQIEIYSFADGIPYYLNMIELPFWNWIANEFQKKSTIFLDEIDFLMRYEFTRPGTYKSILEAIAFGNNTLNEIKMYIKSKRTDISPYLKNLIEVDMITREVPITENVNSRRGRYFLKDHFLQFWFRFIYPNLSSIEEGVFEIELIQKQYPAYLGPIFEDIIKNLLIRASDLLEFTKIGRWWWKDHEIDLLALNQLNKVVTFIECKWQKNVNAKRIMKNLIKKTEHVDWYSKERQENFMIFARSFYQTLTEYKGKNVKCYDLDDIERITKKR
ncbi:MAG: ATP-binding protein [Promethearchaeia archaeon]